MEGGQMGQRKRRKSAAEDLATEMKLNNQLKHLIYSAIAEAHDSGAFILLRVPWRLVRELSEYEQRREKQREQN
jgi:hypothetical protein